MDLLKCVRLDNIIYALISSKLATLAELRDVYDCEEALDLYELYTVNAYNKSSIHKAIRK